MKHNKFPATLDCSIAMQYMTQAASWNRWTTHMKHNFVSASPNTNFIILSVLRFLTIL